MAKRAFEFTYSAIGGGKTANMILRARHSELCGKRILLAKPQIDTRHETGAIRSRSGIDMRCDVCAAPDFDFAAMSYGNIDILFVDEAQFLSCVQIEQLREVADTHSISVLCYGLLTDFRRNLFEGSKRLVELCDRIVELDVTCNFCGENAKFNLKYIGGQAVVDGPVVDISAPGAEKYVPVCHGCWSAKTSGTDDACVQAPRTGPAPGSVDIH